VCVKGSANRPDFPDDSTNDTYDDSTMRDDVYDETTDGVAAKNEPGADVYDDGETATPSSPIPKVSGTVLVRQPSAATQVQQCVLATTVPLVLRTEYSCSFR